ncbi:periplasmic component of amino acid ABC-type transporter/signal transduction system [Burkholderiales bacterium JOSHI_001]|nr:periplasmic component of amino acid ABC-type transporter/signal transduction system [Burkholderiales bacterium JOSHI_001]
MGPGLRVLCRAAAVAMAALAAAGVPGWVVAAEVLNPAQLQWLAAHPVVRFAPEADYGPMVFAGTNGQPQGLSVDLLALVSQRVGLRVQATPAAPLHQLLAQALRREVDLISSLRPTPERAQFLLFTQPYVAVAAVLVQRRGSALATGPADLAGRPVAVGRGYAVEAVMRQRHPQVNWQAVDDDAQALRGVVAGRFDAAVADAASVAYIVERERLDGLVAGAQVGFNYELSFAVRKDWPQLRDILDAGIRAVDAQQRRTVLGRWLPGERAALAPPKAPLATRIGLGLLVLSLLVASLLAWHLHRRRGRPPRHG